MWNSWLVTGCNTCYLYVILGVKKNANWEMLVIISREKEKTRYEMKEFLFFIKFTELHVRIWI